MTAQGNCLLLLLLQVLVASLGASVLPSSSSSSVTYDGSQFFFGDSGAKIESLRWTYPDFKEPTEKEWIKMISEVLSATDSPSAITVHIEDSGSFNNSDGVNGTFMGKADVRYEFGENTTKVTSFSATKTSVEGYQTAEGKIQGSLCSYEGHGQTVCSIVKLGVSFDVKGNDTYVQTGSSLGFSESVSIQLSNTSGEFLYNGLELVNSSNFYSIKQSQAFGDQTYDKADALINGTSSSGSTPLSIGKEDMGALPKDRASLIRHLVSSRDISGLWASTTNYETCLKFGKTPSFDTVSQTQVFDLQPRYTSTAKVHGDLTVKKDLEDQRQVLLHDFLNSQDFF